MKRTRARGFHFFGSFLFFFIINEKHAKTHKKHLIENGSFHTSKPRKPCHYWADGDLKKPRYFYIIKIRRKLIKKSILKTNVFLEWTQPIYKSRWQNCPCFFSSQIFFCDFHTMVSHFF